MNPAPTLLVHVAPAVKPAAKPGVKPAAKPVVKVVSRSGGVKVAPPPAHPAHPAQKPPAVVNHVVSAHPVTLQQAAKVTTINPATLHWLNPMLVLQINAMPKVRGGFALPTLISPVPAPTDQTLLEEPQDANKKHYFPGYSIATTGSGTQLVQWVSLEPVGKAFHLIVHLTDNTPPALSTGHVRIDAPTRYLLTANLQQRVVTWDFGTAATEGATLKLTLPIPDLNTRNQIYQAMTDAGSQAKLILRRSVTAAVPVPPQARPAPVPGKPVPAPPPPMFRSTPLTVDTTVPFTFSKDLDQNVFAQLDGVAGKPISPWNIVRVNWNGRPYAYYQDRTQPSQVYFLPDSFKIARGDKAPRSPKLIVHTNGDDVNSVTLTLSYIAQPVWSSDRIAAAAIALQPQLSLTAPPSLAVFEGTSTALSLQLPPQDSSASVTSVPQTGVTIDIGAGIAGSVTLKLNQFQQIYDALFDDVSELLSGQVSVTVDQDVETIPFIARAGDFVGDIFDTTTTLDPQANRVTCVLRNAVESTIHVDSLVATLVKNGKTVPNAVEQISPPLPVDLVPVSKAAAPQPTTSLTATLQLAPDQSIDSATKVLFDFTGVHVVPDSKAIWQAIMQNQVVGPVSRPVTARLFAAVVTKASPQASVATAAGTSGSPTPPTPPSPAPAPPAPPTPPSPAPNPPASPAEPILAVQVVFESGQTASFDASQTADGAGFLNQKVNLAVPVEQYVLHEADTGNYRYRVVLITRAGETKSDWITDNADSFFVQVD